MFVLLLAVTDSRGDLTLHLQARGTNLDLVLEVQSRDADGAVTTIFHTRQHGGHTRLHQAVTHLDEIDIRIQPSSADMDMELKASHDNIPDIQLAQGRAIIMARFLHRHWQGKGGPDLYFLPDAKPSGIASGILQICRFQVGKL